MHIKHESWITCSFVKLACNFCICMVAIKSNTHYILGQCPRKQIAQFVNIIANDNSQDIILSKNYFKK
jgi:hypothetical protein